MLLFYGVLQVTWQAALHNRLQSVESLHSSNWQKPALWRPLKICNVDPKALCSLAPTHCYYHLELLP
jgi:hypothetical protein